MNNPAGLRQLLQRRELLVAPGAYDAISARTIEQSGFEAVYMTGSGTSAARGFPDFGLVTMTEMAENAGVIARSVSIPLIADADTGYGNELNVTRTVREYEARGVAGLHIEDQVSPKRCGHLDGKEIVSREEFLSKIRAAVQARRDPDFLVIARTDSRATHGLDEAIGRANDAIAAGADMAFVEAPANIDEMAAIPRRVQGPCMLNIVPGGKTPVISLDEVQAMGYRLAILPGILLRSAIATFDRVLADLAHTRLPKAAAGQDSVLKGFQRFGADEWNALRRSADRD
ncbi:isocitrate lyase/PEP mutase family protein [Candidimonas nitroreducens]|uniref:Carboxyvinyl-carboxyphosphonate phosphorylmutase n=1 Tax=Candidimonas nitroreducens TaxID=683354 RepID=A0A225MRF5_9BURK|nr:isocitrate lyase/PEP mutase family protein [Candidimonas nitroreducens]OWT63957.1 carboxyvinyl-carboxyphosphonate phosphorylmutase [Candidimonas nitroreducens]